MEQKALLLEQIAEARKSIRRKSLAYKLGKQVAEDVLKENLKPITEPLEKILGKWSEKDSYSGKRRIQDDTYEYDFKKVKKMKNNTSSLYNNNFKSALDDDADDKDDTVIERNDDNMDDDETPNVSKIYSTLEASTPKTSKAKKYLQMLIKNEDKNLDTKTGVGYLQNGAYMLGDTEVYFDNENNINLGNTEVYFDDENHINLDYDKYFLTNGMIELLFKKVPGPNVTDQDQANYIKILKSTNAYRKRYKPNASFRDDKTEKSAWINRMLNTSGQGLSQYMFEKKVIKDVRDDPNKLDNRLKSLVTKREAEITNYENEIKSIIDKHRQTKVKF